MAGLNNIEPGSGDPKFNPIPVKLQVIVVSLIIVGLIVLSYIHP